MKFRCPYCGEKFLSELSPMEQENVINCPFCDMPINCPYCDMPSD